MIRTTPSPRKSHVSSVGKFCAKDRLETGSASRMAPTYITPLVDSSFANFRSTCDDYIIPEQIWTAVVSALDFTTIRASHTKHRESTVMILWSRVIHIVHRALQGGLHHDDIVQTPTSLLLAWIDTIK